MVMLIGGLSKAGGPRRYICISYVMSVRYVSGTNEKH